MEEFKKIKELIEKSTKIVICTHISPDPDAIGSSGALCLALINSGYDASLYLPENMPERLQSFFPIENLIFEVPDNYSYLLIGCDCATKKRLGDNYKDILNNASNVINIDHHVSNEKWGDVNYIVGNEAASAILIYDFINFMNYKINPEIANLLYAGIMDDTGSFRFSNTSKKALSICSDLLGNGANPSNIAEKLYFQEPMSVIHLKAKAISTLKTVEEGKAVYAYLSLSMRSGISHSPGDSEGIIEIVRSVKGAKIAFFLREKEPNEWRVSARSKSPDCNVSNIAELFGGGGHYAAAGFTINGTEKEVLSRLDLAIKDFFKKSN